jgi:hypothetical protein
MAQFYLVSFPEQSPELWGRLQASGKPGLVHLYRNLRILSGYGHNIIISH